MFAEGDEYNTRGACAPLFFTLADIIDYHRPTAFVLENVKNLRSHDQGRTFQVMHDTLTKALGYTAYYQVIDARSVVPQHRDASSSLAFANGAHSSSRNSRRKGHSSKPSSTPKSRTNTRSPINSGINPLSLAAP